MSDGSSGPAWGRVDQAVMRDPALSIEAKGIYAYLSSFADAEGKCYPSITTILGEIGMSKTRYYKYLEELKQCKIIRVEAGQRTKGNFSRNIYYIARAFPDTKETPPFPENEEKPQAAVSSNHFEPFPKNKSAVSLKPFPEFEETNISYNTTNKYKKNKNKINNSHSVKTSETDADAAIATIREILNSRRWKQSLQIQGGHRYLYKPSAMSWDDVITAAHEYIAQFPEPTAKTQNDWIQWYSFSDYLEKNIGSGRA